MTRLGSGLKKLLDFHYYERNENENFAAPDPLFIARRHRFSPHADIIALFCALFAYGNAGQILKFLQKIEKISGDFALFLASDDEICAHDFPKYRFSDERCVKKIFLTLARIAKSGALKKMALKSYENSRERPKILPVIYAIQDLLYENFGIFHDGSLVPAGITHIFCAKNTKSALKRYNLFLRWMVRADRLDLGLWREISPSDLLLPLDVHIFRICQKFQLTTRKICDLRACIEATETLSVLCPLDPVRYDFALYRAGQQKIL